MDIFQTAIDGEVQWQRTLRKMRSLSDYHKPMCDRFIENSKQRIESLKQKRSNHEVR